MSVSADYASTVINLYCNESPDDVVSLNTKISEINGFSAEDESFLSGIFDSEMDQMPIRVTEPVSDEDESFLSGIFDSELDHMPGTGSVARIRELSDVVTSRRDAVNWIIKVHNYYRFRPETAYLSVNYLDRFLLSHTLPQGKGWPVQLLAVACLSLAAKLEETRVPVLVDIQILRPRFFFKPGTVQRMELLVMASLKWRLRMVTPFHYLQYFIANAKLPCLSPHCDDYIRTFSTASDLIINTCRDISFLDYTPSTIAAAAVLWATHQTTEDIKFGSFHKKVNKEMVTRCYNLIKRNLCQLSHSEVVEAIKITGRCHVTEKFCQKNFKSCKY